MNLVQFLFQPCIRRIMLCLGSAAPLATLAFAQPPAPDHECSLAKTNQSCTLTIDRRVPLAPPTIQMYPGAKLTVQLRDPYFFERYYLDFTSGQLALAPDVASSIVNGLLTPLQKIAGGKAEQVCTDKSFDGKIPNTPADITTYDDLYTGCLKNFASEARKIYKNLELFVYPDSHSNGGSDLGANTASKPKLDAIAVHINDLNAMEAQLSAAIAYASSKLDKLATTGTTMLSTDQAATLRRWVSGVALADAAAKDLAGYSVRIGEITTMPSTKCLTAQDTSRYKPAIPATPDADTCISLYTLIDPPVANANMLTRQITYAVNALNLVLNSQEAVDSSKRKTIVSVTVFFGDSHWEASAGIFLSTLAIRSFPVVPIFTNGVVTDKQVGAHALHPTVVPFVAANYRLGRDLTWTKWRSAWYFTIGVGVNSNTTSADFVVGPSLSWRALMLSALWHVGHDARATQGIYKGESLGAGFSGSVPTESYWRFDRVALGISVRVPSITGR